MPPREGWLWMVWVIDCHDRDLIGRRSGQSAETALCLAALTDAVWERLPDALGRLKATAPALSHDWGWQFTSRRYQAELKTLQVKDRPTMIGSPEQNGIKERFCGALKDEEVWPKEYDTRAEAIAAIAAIDAWIDFYRTERPHQALGYLTPRRVPRPDQRGTRLNHCSPCSLKFHLPTGPLHHRQNNGSQFPSQVKRNYGLARRA